MEAPAVPGYLLQERLGAGASGVVWAAVRRSDGLRVAIKVVRLAASATAADQAALEYGLLTRRVAEHVVGLHEAVPLPGAQPALALVLQLLEGGSLRSVVAARGHLSPGETVTVLSPVARALAGLHAHGVLHGDVAPGNVLLERTGRPVLADLGVARLAGAGGGDIFATEGYLAPEVALGGQEPAAASDVYAVGALAWYCLTGSPPGHPVLRPPLEQAAPDLPDPVRDVVLACLAADPADRPTAAEAALALFDAAPAQPIRLASGGDDVSGLTHRIRAAAAAEEPMGTGEPGAGEPGAGEPGAGEQGSRQHHRPRHRRAAWRRSIRSRGSTGARSGVRGQGEPLAGSGRQPRGRPARGAGRGAALLVAVLGSLAVAVTLLGPRVAAAWEVPARPVTATPVRSKPPSAAAPAPVAPVATGDVRRRRDAPSASPLALLQALADARARAWVRADPALMSELDLAGSVALAADQASVQRVRRAGERYAQVGFTVRSARSDPGSRRGPGAGPPGAARVVAVVDSAAYLVVGKDGRAHRRPAVPGSPLTFQLSWTAHGWRVAAVTAGPAPS